MWILFKAFLPGIIRLLVLIAGAVAVGLYFESWLAGFGSGAIAWVLLPEMKMNF